MHVYKRKNKQKYTLVYMQNNENDKLFDRAYMNVYNHHRGDTMPYNESQKKATMKYAAANYERLNLQLKKGMKEIYRAQAKENGMSLNAYIVHLLEEKRKEGNNE